MSLSVNVLNAFTRAATEAKALRTLVNGNAGDLSSLTTTAKGNLVAAINELKAALANASGINDNATGAGSSWSSTKTRQEIDTAVAGILGGATATDRDTIKELGDLLNAEQSATAAINSALGNRVRFDAAQTITAAQAAQARTNIGAASATDVGPTDTDFVAAYVAALA